MAKRYSTEEIIEAFREAHGNYYDYRYVEYKDAHTPVRIICPKHGEFLQSPHHHKRGRGCPKCGAERGAAKTKGQPRKTTKQFIEDAKAVHGNRYDYSKTVYTGVFNPVTITCPKHGDFSMLATEHLKGRGCRHCGYENRRRGVDSARAVPQEEFLIRLQKRFGAKIECLHYNGISNNGEFICHKHNKIFTITPKQLLKKQGCPICSSEYRSEQFSKRRFITAEQFLTRAREVHGNTYEYDLQTYDSMTAKVRIKCKKHGWFWQSAHNHLRGSGCRACVSTVSRTEKELLEQYKEYNPIPNYRGFGFEIDIWLPEHRVGIEYHGTIWHSTRFKKNYLIHATKADMADEHGIRLFQIFDFELNEKRHIIEGLINGALGKNIRLPAARHWTLVDRKTAASQQFLRDNHIQGNRGTHHFYLERNGIIGAVLTASRRKGEWYIERFAVLAGHYLPGAFERLLTAFIRQHKPTRITSFVDRRLFTGKRLESIGFKLESITPPNYWYVDSQGNILGTRMKFQKHMLPKFLGSNFDPRKTELENMHSAGYYRVYDAGHRKYILDLTG